MVLPDACFFGRSEMGGHGRSGGAVGAVGCENSPYILYIACLPQGQLPN